MPRILVAAALLVALAILAPAPAQATVVFYLSETPANGFELLPVLDSFDGVLPKDTGLASIVSAGITYTAVTGCGDPVACPGNVWVTGVPYGNFGIPGDTAGAILTANGNEYFTMTPGFTVRSMGFDVYTITEPGNPNSVPGARDVVVTVLTIGGPSVLNLPAPIGNFGFLGIVSDDPILMVTWQADLGGVRNTGIDNIRVSETAAPIPEPGTLLLLGSGLTGLAMRRRRRHS
jgi:hypothetical protein